MPGTALSAAEKPIVAISREATLPRKAEMIDFVRCCENGMP